MKYSLFTLTFLAVLALPAILYGQRGSSDNEMDQVASVSASKSSFDPSQSQTFGIYMGKHKIGTYEVEKIDKNGFTEYLAVSECKVKIMGQISVGYTSDSKFKGETLVDSHVKSYRNGKLKNETQVSWNGSDYTIVKDGKTVKKKDPINNTTVELYFQVPDNNEEIFSEFDADLKKIKHLNAQTFVLLPPGKSKGTEYVYQNSDIQQVNISMVFGSFSIIRD